MSIDPRLAHHPFLASEARSLGISQRSLRSADYRSVFHGVMVRADVPDTLVVRSRAALLMAPPGAVISHWTSGGLWGGVIPHHPWVHFTTFGGHQLRMAGIRHHRHAHPLEVTRRHGLPVTSPLQTFGHLARGSSLVDLVALGDSLVKKDRFSPEELISYAEGWPWQCRSRALAAARLVREGVDSGPETALRLLMVLAGLPEPTVNVPIRDAHGEIRFRLDLGYEGPRLAIEYDGRWHDEDEKQQQLDRDRRSLLNREEGWDFVIVKAKELYWETESLLRRLCTELAAHGIPVPPVLSDAWRPHFRCPAYAA